MMSKTYVSMHLYVCFVTALNLSKLSQLGTIAFDEVYINQEIDTEYRLQIRQYCHINTTDSPDKPLCTVYIVSGPVSPSSEHCTGEKHIHFY